ncbi:MAG: M20/M25/M40 family metallo-hydrolase [Nitrospinaceae bacterium]
MSEWDRIALGKIQPGSDLVEWHLEVLKEMVRIDSRSFNVGEFEGDRQSPSDMREILQCAREYLETIGFDGIKINRPLDEPTGATPILMAEIGVSPRKPTLLFYAHLDKQPYMDNEKFEKWSGVPPTELRWNADRTRAYGRGAADDLSGVIAIGMTVDAILKSIGYDPKQPSRDRLSLLPCNLKVIYETEEECGSHSLIDQIRQNQAFFADTDCVVITDVVNPVTGIPGLTTSLRGIIQLEVTLTSSVNSSHEVDAQTALYKLLATLIYEDHSLAVEPIARADRPVTAEEEKGYARVPTGVDLLRETAGLLPGTRLTVPPKVEALLAAQLRKSFINVRPGHRVAGSIIFGVAGARLTLRSTRDPQTVTQALEKILEEFNPFNLKLTLHPVPTEPGTVALDLVLQSATKDPHSGINGGPFPVPELQLARMIDRLVEDDGSLHPDLAPWAEAVSGQAAMRVQSLFVEADGKARPFEDPTAKATVEVRLAPGNEEHQAAADLQAHLEANAPAGFNMRLHLDKGASPWMTRIVHPVFTVVMDSLETGFGQKPCLYGCGGSIPFVAKLLDALGDIPPLCLGAYDPDARMHEPGESLSLADLLGCARSMVHLIAHSGEAFPQP